MAGDVAIAGGVRRWRGWVALVEDDRTARRTMWLVWPLGLALIAFVGASQWFIRDDWAFIFSRERYREVGGYDTMLFLAQDGHWMMWPILVFRGLRAVFGLGSYMPYLVVLWATHIGIVLLVRVWMRRFGVSAWLTTLMSAVVLVFGAGWENLLFAVQIVYNFSILAFLGQTLLVDHDGPVDRRDYLGAGLSLIGVSSSGFGPFFGLGVGTLLVLRRRWLAAAVAVVPQALAWIWWWTTWGDDPAGDQGSANVRFIVRFVEHGLSAALGSLVGAGLLGGAAVVLCAAMAVWPRAGARRRTVTLAMLVTAAAMYVGIAARREFFGVEMAGSPRYMYVAVTLLAPTVAFGLDQAKRFAPWGRWVPRVLLVFAFVMNVQWLFRGGDRWADLAEADRRTFALVAGSDARLVYPDDHWVSEISPDVQLSDLPALIDAGAIVPDTPDDAIERAQVDQALGLKPLP